MNESKHTPGPWVARVDGPFVCGGDSTVVEAITEDGEYVRREIATLLVDTGDGEEGSLTFAEDIANARLIAAAPELLAELRRLSMVSSGGFTGCVVCNYVTEAGHREGCSLNSAILKATGGRP